MTISFLFPLNEYWQNGVDALRRDYPQHSFAVLEDADCKTALLQASDAVVAGRLPVEELEAAPALQALFVPFAGVNPFPLSNLKQRGVMVSNAHGAAPIVAERTLGLAMALTGRLVETHNALARGTWMRSGTPKDFWFSLHNKTACICGVGHIGSALAGMLQAFSCRVLGFARRERSVPPRGFDRVSVELAPLLDAADIVFLTLPLSPVTEGIIDAALLGRMQGKYLVNIGRAALVEEEALYRALQNDTLAGAAMDVHYAYPRGQTEPVYPSRFALHELPNVVLTPHTASHTAEARRMNADACLANLRHYLDTGQICNAVDLDAGY